MVQLSDNANGYVVADAVRLVEVNHAPTTSGIRNMSFAAGCASTSVDLWPAFEDAEDTASSLSYQVTCISDAGLFTSVQIDPETGRLKLDFPVDASGTAELTIRATDPGGLYVETTFAVAVLCPEGDPILYWHPQSGSHIWSTSVINWSAEPDGSGPQYYRRSGYTAVFGSSPDTVTVAGAVTYAGIQFATSGYTVVAGQSASLSPSGTGGDTITIEEGCTATISCAIGGTDGLTKAGDGALILSGGNGYTGGTTISAGNLTFAAPEDVPGGTSNILIDSGGALDVSGAYSSVGAGSAAARLTRTPPARWR